jgi:hypothetical protein
MRRRKVGTWNSHWRATKSRQEWVCKRRFTFLESTPQRERPNPICARKTRIAGALGLRRKVGNMLICAFAAHSDLDPRCEISEGRMFTDGGQTEIGMCQ